MMIIGASAFTCRTTTSSIEDQNILPNIVERAISNDTTKGLDWQGEKLKIWPESQNFKLWQGGPK